MGGGGGGAGYGEKIENRHSIWEFDTIIYPKVQYVVVSLCAEALLA